MHGSPVQRPEPRLALPHGRTRFPEVLCRSCQTLRLAWAMEHAGRCGKCCAAEQDAQVEATLMAEAERRAVAHGVRPRFNKWGRAMSHQPDERRSLAAARGRERREREALGFLADVIPVMTAEERVTRNRVIGLEWRRNFRRHRAAEWRRMRAELRALSPHERAVAVLRWNASPVPADPEYLADHLTQLRRQGVIGAGQTSDDRRGRTR